MNHFNIEIRSKSHAQTSQSNVRTSKLNLNLMFEHRNRFKSHKAKFPASIIKAVSLMHFSPRFISLFLIIFERK